MPARIPKPLGANLSELKDYYASKGFEKDAKIIESAISHECSAFRFNYHKNIHKGRKVIYYVSIVFEFMDRMNALKFLIDYSNTIE